MLSIRIKARYSSSHTRIATRLVTLFGNRRQGALTAKTRSRHVYDEKKKRMMLCPRLSQVSGFVLSHPLLVVLFNAS